MKTAICILAFLLVLVALFSCEDEKLPNDPKADFICKITFNNNRIQKFERYNSTEDTLLFVVDFVYLGDKVIETTTENNLFKSKHVYFQENGITKSSVDSSFVDGVVNRIDNFTYIYDEVKLVRKEKIRKIFQNGSWAIYNNFCDYTYSSNGNIIRKKYNYCWDSFEYDEMNCMFDVINFGYLINGEVSKNLVSKATYREGCPEGPSYIFPQNRFEYVTDANGYVTFLTETYISGYAHDTTITNSKYKYYFE